MRSRFSRQAGTTLIEPLVATAVIGALAAAALPQFAELGSSAQATQLQGVAAAATSAMHANQGACLVSAHSPRPGGCVPVDNCAAVGRLLFGGLPVGYAVADQPLGSRNGFEASCTVTQLEGGLSERFAGVSAGL
ncbi:MAG: type II secretion system protein [Rubrivivax sp.]|nr:type II secretion system protein [Rubrivivax sp.]